MYPKVDPCPVIVAISCSQFVDQNRADRVLTLGNRKEHQKKRDQAESDSSHCFFVCMEPLSPRGKNFIRISDR